MSRTSSAVRPAAVLRAVLAAVAVGLLTAACAAGVASRLLHVRAVPVLTGSMSPQVPAGSLVLTTRVAPDALRVGDVIAFAPPLPYRTLGGRPVLHRVASLQEQGGTTVLRTRGDANTAVDPWSIGLRPSATFGRSRVVVPHLGRLVAGGRGSALALVLGAALLLAAAGVVRAGTRATCSCRPADDRELHTGTATGASPAP